MTEAFQRLVVQIDVRHFDFVQVERIGIHREAMIVRVISTLPVSLLSTG